MLTLAGYAEPSIVTSITIDRHIYRELAKLSKCPRTRMMYAKNHARLYKREKAKEVKTA